MLLVGSMALAACGGSATTEPSPALSDTTSGGESTEEQARPALRTTIPIPVPQPAIAREQMSADLDALWERVELAVATRPPEAPPDATLETIEAWAQGPFAQWLTERTEASAAIQAALGSLEDKPAHERGIAAGLFGYLQEDMVADVRGAPIPESISSDPELLRIYDESMLTALLPFVRVAAQAYRFCEAAFVENGDDAWEPWASYCRQRFEDVARIYVLNEAPTTDDAEEATDHEAE
jgi:hypothetical protein